jgi:predicted RND superfamily exporter protein
MFRSLRGLMLPLAGVIFSVVWSMGLMSFFKIPIYPMTTMIPILLMAMGVAYGLHVVTRYYIIHQEQRGANPHVTAREVTIITMMELWSPLIMASTTDAAGFLSLLTSKIKPIFHTGVFTSIGLLVALAFSLALIPAILVKMKLPKPRAEAGSFVWEDKLFLRMGTGIYNLRKGLVALAVVIFFASLFAARNLIVNSDPMSNFNDADPIPKSTKIVNEQFGGAMMIYTTLEANEPKRFLDPEALKAVDRFQDEVKAMTNVGAALSAVDFLKMMNRAMNENDPAADVTPPTRNLVGTYLMLYSGENIDHYINYDANKLNIETRVTTSSTKELERIMGLMEKAADKHLRSLPDVKVAIGGHARIVVDMLNIIVYGQIYSIFLSMIMVFIITSVMFRSPIAGLFTAVPISLATVFNFATMSVLGVPLEPATAVTSCIGIGVGVDYGIHFIAKYQIMWQRGLRGKELVELTMASAGKSIFFNAAVVIGGFLVLVTSMFPPVRHMGFMVSLNMFTSYLASVTILPAMLAWLQPAFIERGQPGNANG